jgi:polysaccharide biosynthesis protein PslH
MKVLLITPYVPFHSQSGGQTRSFYQIKHLSKKLDITLFCYYRSQEEKKYQKELKKYCRKIRFIKRGSTWTPQKILFTGLSPYPFLISNYYSQELKNQIAQELEKEKYNLIHVECFYLMPNIPQTKIPVIMVDQTIEHAVYKHFTQTIRGVKSLIKPLLWLDVLKLKYWETYYWKNTPTVAAVSADDQKLMKRVTGRTDIEMIPNGVAGHYFETKKSTPKTKFPSFLFGVSNMKWMQNKEAAILLVTQVWPLIKKKIKNAHLFIIGRYAPETLSHLSSSDITVREAQTDGQKDDPRSYYQRAWALVAPIKSGGGSRTKFFEAMATGLPVITTREGIEGINVKHKHSALIATDLKNLADLAINLVKNPKKARLIGKNAQDIVYQKYSWQHSSQTLFDIYKKHAC